MSAPATLADRPGRPRRPTYAARLVSEARHLHGEGWTALQIQRIFARRGEQPAPSRTTIMYWVDERFAADQRERNRIRNAAEYVDAATFTLSGRSDAYKAAFVARLHAESVPRTSIAKVCRVVFDEPWNRERVSSILDEALVAA